MPPRALLFAVVGALVAAGSVAGLASAWRFGQTAARASGEVARLNAGGSHPEIRFVTGAGEAVEYPQGGLVFGFRTGDRVAVLYDPAAPQQAVVDRVGARYGVPALGALLGAVLLAVAAGQRRRP